MLHVLNPGRKPLLFPKLSERNLNPFLENTKDLYFLSIRKKSFHVVESAGRIKDLHALESDSMIKDVKCSRTGKKAFFVPELSEKKLQSILDSQKKKKVSMLLNQFEG